MKNIQKCQYYYVLQQYLTKNPHEAYNKLDQAYETSEKPTISPAMINQSIIERERV
jgi:hypothetical protein